MAPQTSEFWTKVRQARDKLADQFINHPDVSSIGIGHRQEGGQDDKEIVLRIHVRDHWLRAKPEERVAFPDQIDGIPVVVIAGDYRLETDTSATDQK